MKQEVLTVRSARTNDVSSATEFGDTSIQSQQSAIKKARKKALR